MSRVVSSELSVPVQVLFASSTAEGIVLDCTVAEEVVTAGPRPIPSGAPFSLVIERLEPSGEDAAMRLLERWCAASTVVEATTSSSSRWLVLSDAEDRLVLEIV